LASDNLLDCIQNIADYLGSAGGGTTQQAWSSTVTPVTTNEAISIDASTGNFFLYDLTANVTSATIVNGILGQQITVGFAQGAGGSHTVSWPTAKYAAGAAPTTSTAAGDTDLVTYVFDGTNWQEIARSIGNH